MPKRTITIRFPSTLHATLLRAAGHHGMSLNAFCVDRLLAAVALGMEPEERVKFLEAVEAERGEA